MSTITPQEILELLKSGESETLEFKSRLPSDHIIARVLSAFANTKGGILLIGVSDDGEITGLSKAGAFLAETKLLDIISSLFPYPVETGRVNINGKIIVFAKVEKVPDDYSPILTSRGELFQRTLSHEVAHSLLHISDVHIKEKLKKTGIKRKVTVFVAMSFREEGEPSLVDYFKAMERAVKATGLPINLVRVDLVPK